MFNIYDICLIGLGPAGIGFISSLNKDLLKNVICFDKGRLDYSCNCHTSLDSKCLHCKSCSIVSGLGGSSRFSCGKMSSFPAGSGLLSFFDSSESLSYLMNSEIDLLRSKLQLRKVEVNKTTQEYAVNYFEKNNIMYKYYDVYEFKKEQYLLFINDIIDEARKVGLNVFYETEVVSVEQDNYLNESIYSITTMSNGFKKKYYAKKIVIATGNINNKIDMIDHAFLVNSDSYYEIGVRVNIPTKKISRYLEMHGDLKLKYKNGRTYCVSKNGYIIAYNNKDILLLEGYVDNNSTSNMTNFAIIFRDDDYLALNSFEKIYKEEYNGIPIKQRYSDYLDSKCSSIDLNEPFIPVQKGNINRLFSNSVNTLIIDFIDSVLIRTMGLNKDDITIYAPELKETADFAIDKSFQVTKDLFIIGSATGKFRGILQSLCSGIQCARLFGGN